MMTEHAHCCICGRMQCRAAGLKFHLIDEETVCERCLAPEVLALVDAIEVGQAVDSFEATRWMRETTGTKQVGIVCGPDVAGTILLTALGSAKEKVRR